MKSIILITCFFYSVLVSASEFKSEKDIRAFTDNMMNQIVKEKFNTAFNSAKPYWPMPAVEIDGIVNKINHQWPIVNQRFGKAIGKEFVKEERIGKSFLRYYYLHKFTKHAIYWRIDFYKPKSTWKINSIIFLDTLDALYD